MGCMDYIGCMEWNILEYWNKMKDQAAFVSTVYSTGRGSFFDVWQQHCDFLRQYRFRQYALGTITGRPVDHLLIRRKRKRNFFQVLTLE